MKIQFARLVQEPAVNERVFTDPKMITVAKTCWIERVEANYCEDYKYLRELICNLCGEQIGSERPIGIGWGRKDGETRNRGLRLCHSCYKLCED